MSLELTPDEVSQRYALLCQSTRVEADKQALAQRVEDGLQSLSQLLENDLRQLARKGSPDDFADIYFALQRELERFREFCAFPTLAQKFVVAFGGGFSAGKSSLINALLGKRLLVTEVDPTTSLPTYLLKGEKDEVSALNLFGHRIGLSDAEFLSLTHDEVQNFGSNISRLLRAAFITRTDFAWGNLALIDTPGYTKDEDTAHSGRTDRHIALTQLNAAQAIVWVINARQGCITEDDVEFLSKLEPGIPMLIALTRADLKPKEDIEAIISGIRTTLNERNLPFVDIVPVSSRKPQEWPVEPVLSQLTRWNSQPRAVRFAQNFHAEFTRYANFLEDEQRQAQRHLNRLNRILVLSESEDAQADAQELKDNAQRNLTAAKAYGGQLHTIRQDFFENLRAVGDAVGIALPEPAAMESQETSSSDLLQLLERQRIDECKGEAPDEPESLRSLMQDGDTSRISSVLGNGLEDLLNPHSASTLDAHCKETYALILAAILNAHNEVNDAQSQLLKALLVSLGLDDVRAKLFAQARNIQQDSLLECRRIISEHSLARHCILDGLLLCRIGKPISELQVRVFAELASFLNIQEELKKSLVDLAKHTLGLAELEASQDYEVSSLSTWIVFLPQSDKKIRIDIAKRKFLPKQLQLQLLHDQVEDVTVVLAENPDLIEQVIEEMVKNGSAKVRASIAKNRCLKVNLQESLLNTGDDAIKQALAKNTALQVNFQKILMEDENWRVRESLCENLSLNLEYIKQLAKDNDSDVRAALAENPNTPEEIQIQMLEDKSVVRRYLANNKSIAKSVQLKLVEDDAGDVRLNLAKNTSIAEDVQGKLFSCSHEVRLALAENANLTALLQDKIFNSSDIELKAALYRNVSLDKKIRQKIENSITEADKSEAFNKWKSENIRLWENIKKSIELSSEYNKYQRKEWSDSFFERVSYSKSEANRLEQRWNDQERQNKELEKYVDRLSSIDTTLGEILKNKSK